MKEKAKKVWGKVVRWLKKATPLLKPYLLLAIVALISVSIFVDRDYIWGHDLYYHAASAEGMVGEGNLFSIFTRKIYGVISNNLGNGEGLFYPPLAHTITAIITNVVEWLGVGGVYLAMKATYFLIVFFAGIFMRKLILLITENKKAALASSIFYMTFPYFLIDIIVRCAMAEAIFFVFMPIVLIGIYYMLRRDYRRFLLYFTVGCIGMVHSHLVMTLFFVCLAIIGFLPNIKMFFKKKNILYFLLSASVSILISLPFLLPMLENKANADYRVFQENFMTNAAGVEMWRVPIGQYFSLTGQILTIPTFISFIGLIMVIYALFRYRNIKTEKTKIFLTFSLIITIVSFVCTTTLFPWKAMPHTFLLIQFPQRLLTFVAFGCAIIAGLLVSKFNNAKIDTVIFILIALSGLFGISRVNSFAYNNLPSAVSAEELHHTSSIIIDYLPVSNPVTHEEKNYDFINSYPSQEVLTDDEEVILSNVVHNMPDVSFEASGVTDDTVLTLPRIYYLGYEIEAEYADGRKEVLPYLMSELGFIDITISKDAKITVTYPGTKLQRVSYWVAGIAIVAFVAFNIYLYKKEKK